MDLLFVPVIVVPAVLAWTAMAAYGMLLYGPAGLALPAFSEGAMWAFAAATTLTRRRQGQNGRCGVLRLGTVLFAAVGAALNFAHGMTAGSGRAARPGDRCGVRGGVGRGRHGAPARDQRCRAGAAQRNAARMARAAAERRETAARRAALRQAPVELDGEGHARLIFEPGTIPGQAARDGGHAAAPRPAPAGGPGPAAGSWPAPRLAPAVLSAPACPLSARPGTIAGQAPAASAVPAAPPPAASPQTWPRPGRQAGPARHGQKDDACPPGR